MTHAGRIWWLDCLLRHWPQPEDARALVAMPLYHKNAMAGAIKPRLASGGSIVLMPLFSPRPCLEALRRHCLAHGPAYAHPRRVVIVDELPLTGARKIDRQAIAARLRALCADLVEVRNG